MKNDSNQGIIKTVVMAICTMAGICVLTLSWCLVTGMEVEQSTGMAYFGVTNALIGYLAGILSKTTPTQSAPPGPIKTETVNTVDNPVNVQDIKE